MHNHAEFCNAHYIKNADYIKFPFSASTIGPRVGAAALDMVGAAGRPCTPRRTPPHIPTPTPLHTPTRRPEAAGRRSPVPPSRSGHATSHMLVTV